MERFALFLSAIMTFFWGNPYVKAYAQDCVVTCTGDSCTCDFPSTSVPIPPPTYVVPPPPPASSPIPNSVTHLYSCQTPLGSCTFSAQQFFSNNIICYCNAFPGFGGSSFYLGQQ